MSPLDHGRAYTCKTGRLQIMEPLCWRFPQFFREITRIFSQASDRIPEHLTFGFLLWKYFLGPGLGFIRKSFYESSTWEESWLVQPSRTKGPGNPVLLQCQLGVGWFVGFLDYFGTEQEYSQVLFGGSWRLSVTTTDIPQHNISDSFGILRYFWILKDFVLCW